MRILPVRTDHASGFAVKGHAASHGLANRRSHGGKHLPLRNLPTNSPGDQAGSGENGMRQIENVSRRKFLRGAFGAGAFVLAVRYVPPIFAQGAPADWQSEADRAAFHPNLFVGIQADGTVYIVAHRSEMGTVIRTSLPLVLADELDADWKRVKIDQGIGDKRYGDQNTDGSHSIRSFFDTMRVCGAAARSMLIQAAAAQWNVSSSECSTELHTVVHKASGRRLGYGDLAGAASKLPVPNREEV